MKRSLLALAVLGAFAGVASAQSSVTIYGQIDQGVAKGNGGTAPNAGANGVSEAWQVKQAHGSRLGFRGNEDMGGGLSAQFLIEHRFQPDTGAGASNVPPAAPSVFWDGGSYVQLTSAAVGSVYLGRWYTPAFWIYHKNDPFASDGVGQVGAAKGYAGFLTPGPNGGGVRSSNTVGYKTPSLGGFTVNAAVGAGEGVNGRDAGINAEYAAGPIYAGAAYEKVSGGPAGAAGNSLDGNSLVSAAFGFDFKFVRPVVYFARAKTGVGSVNTNKTAYVALTAPIGPGMLKASYLRYQPQDDKDEQKFAIGYDYFLSKRTRLYADFATAKKDGLNGTAPTSPAYTDNRAYNLGVRHDF